MDGMEVLAGSGGSALAVIVSIIVGLTKANGKVNDMKKSIDDQGKQIVDIKKEVTAQGNETRISIGTLHGKINAIALDHEGRIGKVEGKVNNIKK